MRVYFDSFHLVFSRVTKESKNDFFKPSCNIVRYLLTRQCDPGSRRKTPSLFEESDKSIRDVGFCFIFFFNFLFKSQVVNT